MREEGEFFFFLFVLERFLNGIDRTEWFKDRVEI